MKFKNKTSFFSFLVFATASLTSDAQLVNAGNALFVQNGATLSVAGNFINLTGTVQNFGNIDVAGNWINNDAGAVFSLASTGIVRLNGANQTIGGTQKTTFPNLVLAGTGIKKLLADVAVRSSLNLSNREFAAEDKNLEVLGTTVNSLNFTTGFVSTDLKGYLYRRTNTASDYVFPLGSRLTGSLVYRPVKVKTKDNLDNTVGLAFVNKDPDAEGFSRSTKRFDVNEINPKYFYLADQRSGISELEYQFVFDKATDGDFNQLVNWINFGLWEKAGVSNVRAASVTTPDAKLVTFTTLTPASKLPLTLSFITPTNDPITIFNSFSPDGDGKNDTWEIKNINLFPDNELTILNRWGNEVLKVKGYNNANAWNGGGLNNGTYFYLLKVNINNEAKVYKGFITLQKYD